MLPHIIPHTVGVEHLGTSKGTQVHCQGELEQVLKHFLLGDQHLSHSHFQVT